MSHTIAIFRTGGIGDVILSTVSISIIKKAAPKATILWFGRQPTLELIKAAFPSVKTFEVKPNTSFKSNFSTIKEASLKIDLILDLQKSLRTILLGRAASFYYKCPYISWNKHSMRRSLMVIEAKIRGRRRLPVFMSQPLKKRFELMRECVIKGLQSLGYTANAVCNETPNIISETVKDKSSAAICLGALYPAKELPLEKIKSLISFISKNSDIKKIFLLGDSLKTDEGNLLQKHFQKKELNIINLCGHTTLREAANVLSTCHFAIANDSALAHLAESVVTPVMMFFGPTHENFGYRPYLPDSKTFSTDINCRPCTKGGKTSCLYKDYKCLHFLELDPIFNHIQKISSGFDD